MEDDQSGAACLQAQFDEIEAMQSIYGDAWHVEKGPSGSFAVDISENGVDVTFHLNLPQSYPLHSPPVYDLFAPTLSTQQKHQLGAQLDDVYLENIGQSVLYQWVETIREFILNNSRALSRNEATINVPSQSQDCDADSSEKATLGATLEDFSEEANACLIDALYRTELSQKGRSSSRSAGAIEILHGEVITDRKSTFQGHLARIHAAEEVKDVLSILLQNKKIANATHNMYAYRISLPNSVIIQDCEDDGETQAGSRMLHLLQIMDVTNIIVIVSRWYGGIHLGPDRFRHINNATRQIVEQAGLLKQQRTKS